jgi:hypothetical protein
MALTRPRTNTAAMLYPSTNRLMRALNGFTVISWQG